MPATKKRTSLRNAGKKKEKVEETPAPVGAGPSATGSITVANNKAAVAGKANAANKATATKEATDLAKAEAKNQAQSPAETVPEEEVVEAPAAVKAAVPTITEVAEPAAPQPESEPEPEAQPSPVPEEADREQVIKPFQAINGTGPAAPVVVINDNEESAGPAAIDQVPMVNGNSVTTSPVPNLQSRIDAVTIPKFNPLATNPPRNANGYEYSNIDEIRIRQYREDIHAYEHDRKWCEANLLLDDISPAESRTYQLRMLDLSHQIRHRLHEIERLEQANKRLYGALPRMPQYGSFNTAQRAVAARETNGYATPTANENRGLLTNGNAPRPATSNGQPAGENGLKRPAGAMSPPASSGMAQKRQKLAYEIPVDPIEFDNDADLDEVMAKGPIMAVQRLGFWKCHLCQTPKYLLAPVGKSPAAPTKWALKDISKMITHFCVMHEEQTVSDRLSELGAAFELNRGPFQYWLKNTKNARIDRTGLIDGHTSIDEVIETLKAGRMPAALQKFSNSANKMRLEPREV